MAKPPARQPAQVQVPLEGMDGVDPTHFDGWDLLTTRDWLAAAAPQVAAAERTLDGYRLAVGLGLWHLRTQADNETAYAIVVADLAQTAGVSSDTLTRWRTSAQRHHRLPSPSPRSEVQQARPKPKAIDVASRPALPLPDPPSADGVTSPPPAMKPATAAAFVPKPADEQGYHQPTTAGDVRRLVALLETLPAATLRKCITAPRLEALAKRFTEASRPERPAATPIPKAARR